MARIHRWLLALLLSAVPTSVFADEAGDEFFEKAVRPLLVERCLKCHGDEKPKGGLKLSSRTALLTGGDTGPAVVAGKPQESLLIQAIQYQDEPKMPPKGKLPAEEIATLTKWVAMGLPWPEAKVETATAGAKTLAFTITDEQRRFWSFQPVKAVPPPAVKDVAWPRNDLDRFILAALQAKGIPPAPRADKRTLIRRATFDLTGLPPAPEDVEAFVKDESPDAYAKLIDHLLASPHYGERWARHWLDVVRYADSLDARGSGAPGDILDAWRYRDWVVEALNQDMPYDKFVRYQIAGDALPPESTAEGDDGFNRSGTIASTMLAIGNWGNGDADKEKILTDIADDNVDVVSRAFMGLTMACARCHDHKFDPIPTRDYYGMAGIFFSTHILPKLTPKGAGETIIRVPLASQAEMGRRKKYEERLAQLEKEVKAAADQQYAAFAKSMKPQAGRYLLELWEYQTRPADQSARTLGEFAQSRGLHAYALKQWAEYLGVGDYRPLSEPVPDVGGTAGVAGWRGTPAMASATANTTGKDVTILTFRLPRKSVAVHPGPASGAVVSWKSPIAGAVRITGRVADADPVGGDGVTWFLDHRSMTGARELSSGDVPNAGSQALGQGKGGDALGYVEVRPGDRLQLVIMPRAEYTCDTTTVDLVISAWEGTASWDLTRDVLNDFHAGNPHADRLGHAGVWQFEDTGTKARPAALDGNPDSPHARWNQAVARGADRAVIERAANEFGAAFELEDGRSPFAPRSAADEGVLPADVREALAISRVELDGMRKNPPPPLMYANAAQEGGTPESPHAGTHDVKIHLRGRYDRLGELVPRHFPTILGGEPSASISQGSGRVELARWLTRPEHPLTARVMVNRLWQHHFGEGIVRTASNFGKLGDRPSHPELLDFLARMFVDSGWSMKAMHRAIMLSATYQQSSVPTAEALSLDADNRLFSRMNRRRLEAESVRDNLLAVAGRLDQTVGGMPIRDFNVPRRTLYVVTIRSDRATFGALFDQADSTAMVDKRVVSTVAPQALYLMNNPFVMEQAKALAKRLLTEVPADDAARIRKVYDMLYGRAPTLAELEVGHGILADAVKAGDSPEAAWTAYGQVLLCANEFIYID